MHSIHYFCFYFLIALIFTSCSESSSMDVKENSNNANISQEKPKHPAYHRLEGALGIYEKIANEGGWKPLPAGIGLIQKGDTSQHLIKIRERLMITGDLNKAQSIGNLYDEDVFAAVEKFQKRHGIKVDGQVGPETIRYLNIPVEEKIKEIKFSLNSWKNLPEILGAKYLLVNVPEFVLKAYKRDREDLLMKVIVGREYADSTPVFNDSIEYIEFNPYWNIPHGIVMETMLPEAKKDLNYLDKNNYEMLSSFSPEAQKINHTYANLQGLERGDIKLRQKPGPDNELGTIKFMFPNRYAIYLHGTPQDHLFEKEKRDFSNGCIRVEKPEALAVFLLQSPSSQWDLKKVRDEIATEELRKILLENKIPIYITYWTAFVEEDGTVNFRDDIYNKNL